MLRQSCLTAAAAVFALSTFGAGARAQDEKLPATGVYNCPISNMHRCVDEKCETRKPPATMEISINFDSKEACVRRGSAACRKPRAFTIVEQGQNYTLVFSKHSMMFSLRPGGKLIGSDIDRLGVVTIIAMCARG